MRQIFSQHVSNRNSASNLLVAVRFLINFHHMRFCWCLDATFLFLPNC